MSIDRQERAELRAVLRRLLERQSTAARVRSVADDGPGFDQALWQQLVELGAAGLLVPEDQGGSGWTMVEGAAVAMELGRCLAVVPFLSSAVLATSALVLAGTDSVAARRWLPRLVDGSAVGTVALTGPNGRPVLGPAVSATKGGKVLVLSGVAGFVLDAAVADLVVVAGNDAGDPVLVALDRQSPGVSLEPALLFDRTRRAATVHLDQVRVPEDLVLARGDAAAAVIGALLDRAGVVLAADSAAGARHIHEVAVAYAKEREQFGRPIGSFQAVKHKLADMYLLVEGGEVAADGAARELIGDGTPTRAAALVAYSLDAAVSVVGDAVQVHGGIGYTWEHECHRYFKRAYLNAALFGDPSSRRARWAEHLLT